MCIGEKKEMIMIILKKCVILHLLSGSLTKGWLLFNPISKYMLKKLIQLSSSLLSLWKERLIAEFTSQQSVSSTAKNGNWRFLYVYDLQW